MSMSTDSPIRMYDHGGDALMASDQFPDRVSLLPPDQPKLDGATSRIRLLWGQHMIRDVIDGRYRAVVCAVNDEDNSHGIVAQLVDLIPASQWTCETVTSYARIFHESVSIHARHDHEPYVLKFDLDSVLVLALLRPKGRDHFTLEDLGRGFRTITQMLAGRADRRPVCTVSFLGAHANRVVDHDGREPTYETILRTMHEAGFRGDAYPPPTAWEVASVGAYPCYPFPAGLDRMRQGSS